MSGFLSGPPKDLYRDGGFDCSGFVNWVFNHMAGTRIPSDYVNAQTLYYKYTTPISEAQAQPGDIVFFKGTYGSDMNYITHVGIYCGNGITLNAGDPIGYDSVTVFRNTRGQQASRVYGRMKGVTVEQRGVDLARFAQVHVGDAYFNGTPATPKVRVVSGSRELTQGTDYDVSYKNNTAVGMAMVTVTGKGRYSGSVTKSFDVLNPADALQNGTYTIVSALSGKKVIDIAGGSTASGTKAQIYSSNGSNAQKFIITREGDGYYTIKNAASGLVLSSASVVNLRNGVTVAQRGYDGSLQGKWMIKKANGGYVIASAWDSNIVLDIPGAKDANSIGLQVYERNNSKAQTWSMKLLETASQTQSRLDKLAELHRAELPDGLYRLYTANSWRAVLDVAGGSRRNGAVVQLYQSNGTDAQVWRVSHDSKGYVTITNAASGLALDVNGASTVPGARVQLYRSNGSQAQKWIAAKSGSSYSIISALSENMRLDAVSGRVSNGTRIDLYTANGTRAQKWSFVKTDTVRGRLDSLAAAHKGDLADGVYELSTANSSKAVLDVPGASKANGKRLQLYKSNGSAAQRWRVSHDAQGYITLTNVASGKVVDVAGASTSNGTTVQQYAGNGSWAQKWVAVRSGSGYVLVSGLFDGKRLDVRGGRTSNGAGIDLYSANGTKAQNWSFKRK